MMYSNRRKFLLGGGAALTLPLLPSLTRVSEAQVTAPLRFLAIIDRNGYWNENFWPDTPTSTVAPGVRAARLADVAGRISPTFSAGFDAYRSKMTMVRGLDVLSTSEHNMCLPLTASNRHTSGAFDPGPYGWSVDAVLEDEIYTATPATRSLRLSTSTRAQTYNSSWSWRDGEHLEVQTPGSAYAGLFEGRDFSSGEPPMLDPDVERNRFVLDRVAEQYRELSSSPRLGIEDRRRLDAYYESLWAAQSGLEVLPTSSGCSAPAGPGGDGSRIPRARASFDVISSAFACDLTRVAVMDLEHATDSDTGTAWHNATHFPTAGERGSSALLPFRKYIADRVLEGIERLANMPDVDGRTVLDNTIVLWSNELAWGQIHTTEGMPTCLFGGTDVIRQGEYVDFTRPELGEIDVSAGEMRGFGVPYNRVLISILEQFGLSPAEYERGGQAGFGEYDGSSHDVYSDVVRDRRAGLSYVFS